MLHQRSMMRHTTTVVPASSHGKGAAVSGKETFRSFLMLRWHSRGLQPVNMNIYVDSVTEETRREVVSRITWLLCRLILHNLYKISNLDGHL